VRGEQSALDRPFQADPVRFVAWSSRSSGPGLGGDCRFQSLHLSVVLIGKTRPAEMLIAQDIRRGEVVIVFDPKGDVDLLRRVFAEAERAGRGGEFFMFHLGHPEISARYNPVGSFSRITEVATRIAGQLPSEGQSAAFKEFVWRFVNMMARALVPDIQDSVLDAAVWFVAHGGVWEPSNELARARDEAALGRNACQRA
jgi:hypothetical protein